MLFGKHINRYYLKHLPALLLGVLSLVMIDVFQLKIPELYGMVINGINTGFLSAYNRRGFQLDITEEISSENNPGT